MRGDARAHCSGAENGGTAKQRWSGVDWDLFGNCGAHAFLFSLRPGRTAFGCGAGVRITRQNTERRHRGSSKVAEYFSATIRAWRTGMKALLAHRIAIAVLGVLLVAALGVIHSQQAAMQTQRFPQFENEDVKVWKSVVLPNQPLTMHRHDHPRVIVALKGGIMKIVEQGGTEEPHIWETGKAYWLPANPPNTKHADVNTGEQPIEVMVVELEKEK
jgi:beta-alanine degradation protein BauB